MGALSIESCDSVGVIVTATGHLNHLCPFRDEPDAGLVSVSWVSDGETLELHSLREYLDTFSQERVSHEELTTRISQDIESAGIKVVAVETEWVTAGMKVVTRVEGTME